MDFFKEFKSVILMNLLALSLKDFNLLETASLFKQTNLQRAPISKVKRQK